jgi:hypothetical protein
MESDRSSISKQKLSGESTVTEIDADSDTGLMMDTYKTYKRRWFGLAQLSLLNIVVSWTVSFL